MRKITSHKDLLARKLELQRQLDAQRTQIGDDLQELRASLGPVLGIASFVQKATTRDARGNVLVKTGANLAIDWATRRIASKHNSLLGTVGGFIVKNLASHLLSKRKSKEDTVATI